MPEQEFQVAGEFIELHKLLKATGLCESGGAAKALISAGEVSVDGVVELRKARKVRPGQLVETGDERILLRAESGVV